MPLTALIVTYVPNMTNTTTETAPRLTASPGTSSLARKADDRIIVKRTTGFGYKQSLSISFQRTVRVADNGETNALPPSLGSFPIYATKYYKDNLPEYMAGKSGYFIPMYRE